MQKEVTLFSIAVLLSTALLLSSCKDRQPLTLTITSTVKIDRSTTENNTNFFRTPLEDYFLTPLVSYDMSNTAHPVLLKGAKPVDDGKVWEISIRDGVRFHDGTVLTADDVVFSIEKRKEMSPRVESIVRAEAADKWTLRLTLRDAVPDITEILSLIYVYPGHILKSAANWRDAFLRHPIGSGPFKVERWLENGIEFSANDSYFDGPPRIKRIVYLYEDDENRRLTSLLKGDADIMLPVSPKTAAFIEKDVKFFLNRQPISYYVALFLNTGSGVFSNLTVRQAVGLALDRKDIILKGIDGAGLTSNSPFSPDMLPEGYTPAIRFYHPDEALELLEKTGWKNGKDGVLAKNGRKLRIRIGYHSSDAAFRRVAEIVSRQLYEIGIEVETIPVNFSEVSGYKLNQLEYDAYLIDSSSYTPDLLWQSRELDTAKSLNYSNYSNREVDSLLEMARKTKGPERIKRIYARIDSLIHDDAPALFLYTPLYFTAANRRFSGAKGYMGAPYDVIMIKDW